MATDLVSEIVEVLSPNITSRIASALGLNQTSTQKAVVAAVPALLASFISYVSKPQGATKLNEVVKKQEPGVPSSLASVIGEPGQKALIDQGASVLTSLLGGKTVSALADAVGEYAGVTGSGPKACWDFLGRSYSVSLEGNSAIEDSMLQASPTFSFRKRTTLARRCRPACLSTSEKRGFLMMSKPPRPPTTVPGSGTDVLEGRRNQDR